MQKIVNVLAVASSVVSLAVVGSGLYVYVNRGAIVDGIKSQALEAVLGGSLPTGTPDLAPPADQAVVPQNSSLGLPVPGGF